MTKTISFSHPDIGELTGTQSDSGINRFLGVQYATIQDRFASPEMTRYDKAETVDGTKPG